MKSLSAARLFYTHTFWASFASSMIFTYYMVFQVEVALLSPLQLVLSQKTLMGTLYGASNAPVEIPRLLDLYKRGKLKLNELVSQTYALEEINAGYRDMLAGKNIRGVIKFPADR